MTSRLPMSISISVIAARGPARRKPRFKRLNPPAASRAGTPPGETSYVRARPCRARKQEFGAPGLAGTCRATGAGYDAVRRSRHGERFRGRRDDIRPIDERAAQAQRHQGRRGRRGGTILVVPKITARGARQESARRRAASLHTSGVDQKGRPSRCSSRFSRQGRDGPRQEGACSIASSAVDTLRWDIAKVTRRVEGRTSPRGTPWTRPSNLQPKMILVAFVPPRVRRRTRARGRAARPRAQLQIVTAPAPTNHLDISEARHRAAVRTTYTPAQGKEKLADVAKKFRARLARPRGADQSHLVRHRCSRKGQSIIVYGGRRCETGRSAPRTRRRRRRAAIAAR